MAAARLVLQRRLGSLLGLSRCRFVHPVSSTGKKFINTIANPSLPQTEPKDDPNSPENTAKATHIAFSNLKSSARHDMAMVFTCKVCETRSVKTACRESYETGVVVARCPGCDNLHLIADRLGWFGQPGSVEDFLAQRGEEVKKGDVDTINLTLEDFVGSNNKSS